VDIKASAIFFPLSRNARPDIQFSFAGIWQSFEKVRAPASTFPLLPQVGFFSKTAFLSAESAPLQRLLLFVFFSSFGY